MDLRHLRYFVIAAEEENFHRASNRLYIAQPALSRRIRDLESELKVQLFERDRKRVRLSPAGRTFLADARRMLEDMDIAGNRARSIARGELGTLTIAMRDTLIRNAIVAKAVQKFISRHKEITVKLNPEQYSSVGAALIDASVDAAFLYSRPRDNADIEYLEIAKAGLEIALPRNHRLANRRSVRMVELKDDKFLWIRRELAPSIFDKVIASCQASGFTPNIVHFGDNQITRMHLVKVGLGVTLVHGSIGDKVPGVVIKPISDLDIPMALDLAWHRSKRSPSLDRLIEVVEDLKADLP